MSRFVLFALLTLTACRGDEGEDTAPTDICWEEEADCCCPPAGSGIDCMPAISECTQWKLDSCDVYCASH